MILQVMMRCLRAMSQNILKTWLKASSSWRRQAAVTILLADQVVVAVTAVQVVLILSEKSIISDGITSCLRPRPQLTSCLAK